MSKLLSRGMTSIRRIQNARQHLPRIPLFHLGRLLGCALRDGAAAAFAAFGHVDDPVGLLDYVRQEVSIIAPYDGPGLVA